MSMKNIEGVLLKTSDRQVNTARGPAKAFSILVNDGSSEEWYSVGFKHPGVADNTPVRFVAKERNGYWNCDPKTLEAVAAAAPAAPKISAAIASNDTRQQSIVWQSSMKTAVDQARAIVELGYSTMPEKAKQADKMDFFLDLCLDLAVRIYRTALNPPDPSMLDIDAEEVGDDPTDEDDDYTPV